MSDQIPLFEPPQDEPAESTEPEAPNEPAPSAVFSELQELVAEAAARARAEQAARQSPPNPEPEGALPELPRDPLDGMDDDEYVDAGLVKKLNQNFQHRISGYEQAFRELYQISTENLEGASRMQSPREWERYGPEIQAQIEQLKQVRLVKPSNYEQAVANARARHWQDYVKEEAERIVANTPESDITGGHTVAVGSSSNEVYELPEHFTDAGIDERAIREMLNRRRIKYGSGPSFEEYMRMVQSMEVIHDGKESRMYGLTSPNGKGKK